MAKKVGSSKKQENFPKDSNSPKIPFQTKDDNVSKLIIEQIESRDFKLTKETKKRLITWAVVTIFLDVLFSLYFYSLMEEIDKRVVISLISILQIIAIICLQLISRSLASPALNENINDFLWREGSSILRMKFYLSIVLSLLALLIWQSNFIRFTHPFQIVALIFAPISYFLYYSIIIVVANKPDLLTNFFLTRIGSLLSVVGLKLVGTLLLLISAVLKLPVLIVFYWLINLSVIIQLFILSTFVVVHLDQIQKKVIRVIKPDALYDILASDLQKKSDQKHAAIIEEKYYKHLSQEARIGVRKYLVEIRLKEMNEEKSRKPIWMIGSLVMLFFFFLNSIGEGLIQDLFLEQIKSFLCSTLKILCQ
jgi:hypothetical protein